MHYPIKYCGISDIGLLRKSNEDAWGANPKHLFFVLADGLGGHKAGEIASKEAVQTICRKMDNLFSLLPKVGLSVQETLFYLKEGIITTNSWIFCLSQENSNLQGMATTLCCFLFHENHILYANVGDSRVYRFRESLTLLSTDHRKMGHSAKNVLTRAIGSQPLIMPDLAMEPVEPEDIYFLCSDGLTDYVKNEEIEEIFLQNGPVEELCNNLVTIAKMRGGNDNITIVMVKILQCTEPT